MLKDRSFVKDIFSSVTQKYDLMNDCMSFGLHRLWKRKMIDLINLSDNANCLDLSCGTGDIAILMMKKYGNKIAKMTLVDPDNVMLKLAKEKMLNFGISMEKVDFVESTAENLNLDGNYDIITLSFGARNFSDLALGLQNCAKILKTGGYLYCMEFSPELKNQTCEKVYHKYLKCVIPKIGKFCAKNKNAYQYLSDSIVNFLKPQDVLALGEKCGFVYTDVVHLSLGIANVYVMKK